MSKISSITDDELYKKALFQFRLSNKYTGLRASKKTSRNCGNCWLNSYIPIRAFKL